MRGWFSDSGRQIGGSFGHVTFVRPGMGDWILCHQDELLAERG